MTPYLIGEGNLAQTIAKHFEENDVKFKWFKPSIEKRYFSYKDITIDKYIFLVAIQDSKLNNFFELFKNTIDQIIVVFSGNFNFNKSLKHNHLKSLIKLHPMMTFNSESKGSIFRNSPFFFQSNIDFKEELIRILLIDNVYEFDITTPEAYHLLGVFASNFQIAFMVIIRELAKVNNISETDINKFITPIMKQTIHNIDSSNSFIDALSGPVKRKDNETIQLHKNYLKEFNPQYEKIYTLLTKVLTDLTK